MHFRRAKVIAQRGRSFRAQAGGRYARLAGVRAAARGKHRDRAKEQDGSDHANRVLG
jgi:hypothetical protein